MDELDKLKTQAEEYLNGWKRAKADLVNYQKQVERERAEWFMYASAGCVKAILPALDSLEAAALQHPRHSERSEESRPNGRPSSVGDPSASPQDDSEVAHGIEKIRDQMFEALKSMGVEAIAVVKEPPNPELHEVVGVEPVEGVSSGLMAREIQRGYTLHGKVLRVAKVIVSG